MTATPALVEYLMALPSKEGGHLVGRGFQQLSLVYLGAGSSVSVAVQPPSGVVMAIGYEIDFGEWPAGAIDAVIMQYGEQVFGGRVDPGMIANGLNHFLAITVAQPVSFLITNRDNIPQQGQLAYNYLTIDTFDRVAETWEYIKRHQYSDTANQALVGIARAMGVEVTPDLSNPWRSSA